MSEFVGEKSLSARGLHPMFVLLLAVVIVVPAGSVLSSQEMGTSSTSTNSGENTPVYPANGVITGFVTNPYGEPITALVLVADLGTRVANSTWAVNGSFVIDPAKVVGASPGDVLRLVFTNGVCVENRTVTWNGYSTSVGTIVLDPPEGPVLPETNTNTYDSLEETPDGGGDVSPSFLSPGGLAGPDLYIERVDISPDPVVVGGKVTVTVVVGGDIVLCGRVEIWVDGVSVGVFEPDYAFTTDTIRYVLDTSGLSGGVHSVKAMIDPDNSVTEVYEDNNNATANFTVWTVPYLINLSKDMIETLPQTHFLESAVRFLDLALWMYERGRTDKTVSFLTDALYMVYRDGNHLEIEYTLLDTIRVALYGREYVDDLVDTVKDVFCVLSQDLGHPAKEILENAMRHYVEALETIARGHSPLEEINQGWDMMYMVYELEPDLLEDAMTLLSPDLEITSIDFDALVAVENKPVTITAAVYNHGPTKAHNVTIYFYDPPPGEESRTLIGTTTIDTIAPGETAETSITWTPTSTGTYTITTTLENTLEKDRTNNELDVGVNVVRANAEISENDWVATGYCEIENGIIIWWNDVKYYNETQNKTYRFPDAIAGNFTVTSTGRVYIKNSTLRIASENPDFYPPYSLIVEHGGELNILSSKVEPAYKDCPYKFIVHGWLNITSPYTDTSMVRWTWGNTTGGDEGGIQLYSDSTARIENSTIKYDKTHNIYIVGCSPVIKNTQIIGAGVGGNGSGVFVDENGMPEIVDCVIRFSSDSGVFIAGGSAEVVNCSIENNSNSGVYLASGGGLELSGDTIKNTSVGIFAEKSGDLNPWGKPDYKRGDLGIFVWYENGYLHINLSSDNENHRFTLWVNDSNGQKQYIDRTVSANGEWPLFLYEPLGSSATITAFIDGKPAKQIFVGEESFIPINNSFQLFFKSQDEYHTIFVHNSHIEKTTTAPVILNESIGKIENTLLAPNAGEKRILLKNSAAEIVNASFEYKYGETGTIYLYLERSTARLRNTSITAPSGMATPIQAHANSSLIVENISLKRIWDPVSMQSLGNKYGVFVENSRAYIHNNYFTTYAGIRVTGEYSRVTIKNNLFHNIYYSNVIYTTKTSQINIQDNVIDGFNDFYIMYIVYTSNPIIINNTINNTENELGGIVFSHVNGGIVENNTVCTNTGTKRGSWDIYLVSARNTKVTNNTLLVNPISGGIHVTGWDISIKNNTISSLVPGTGSGIMFKKTTIRSKISNNIINSTRIGVTLYSVQDNTVDNNTFTNTSYIDIYLRSSTGITITNNTMNRGIFISPINTKTEPSKRSYFNTHTIKSNLVNGEPVYYYKNETEKEIFLANVGQLIVANCTNVSFVGKNTTIKDAVVGVETGWSNTGTEIKNISMENCSYGILLVCTKNTMVQKNTIKNGEYWGAQLASSENISLWENSLVNTSIFLTGRDCLYDLSRYFSSHDIPPNNTVNNLPVRYVSNLNGSEYTVPYLTGEVIVANATGSTVVLPPMSTAATLGVEVAASNNTTIKGALVGDFRKGIHVLSSINCVLSGFEIKNTSMGLQATYTEKITVDYAEIHNIENTGIYVFSSNNMRIKNSEIYNLTPTTNPVGVFYGSTAIYLASYRGYPIINFSIDNCTISNTERGVFYGIAYLSSPTKVLLINNTVFYNNTDVAVHLPYYSKNASVSITNSTFRENGFLSGYAKSSIYGYETGSGGPEVKLWIENNTFIQNNLAFLTETCGGGVYNFYFVHNRFTEENGDFLFRPGGGSGWLINNTFTGKQTTTSINCFGNKILNIVNNTFTNYKTILYATAYNGQFLYNNSKIKGNTFRNSKTGILLHPLTNSKITRNLYIENNTFINTSCGIDLYYGENFATYISSNNISEYNTGTSLHDRAMAEITNNVFDTGTYGIYVSSGGTANLEYNTFKHNQFGLWTESSKLSVSYNKFIENKYGLYISPQKEASIVSNNFTANYLGLWSDHSNGEVVNNTFYWNLYGLFWEGNTTTGSINNNSFVHHMATGVETVDEYPFNLPLYRYNGTGAYLYRTNVSFVGNNVTDAVYGLVLNESACRVVDNVFLQYAAEGYPYTPWRPPEIPSLPGDWDTPGSGLVRPPPGGGGGYSVRWIYDRGIYVYNSEGVVLENNRLWGHWDSVVIESSENVSVGPGNIVEGIGYYIQHVIPTEPFKRAHRGITFVNDSVGSVVENEIFNWPTGLAVEGGSRVTVNNNTWFHVGTGEGEVVGNGGSLLVVNGSLVGYHNAFSNYRNGVDVKNGVIFLNNSVSGPSCVSCEESSVNLFNNSRLGNVVLYECTGVVDSNTIYGEVYVSEGSPVVSNNTFREVYREAVVVYTRPSTGVPVVRDNVMSDFNTTTTYHVGIAVYPHGSVSENGLVVIENNTIINATVGVLLWSNATVKNNTVSYCDTGVYVYSDFTTYYHPVVRANEMDHNNWSIYLLGTDTVDGVGLYENNTIGQNNTGGAVWQQWWARARVLNNTGSPVEGARTAILDENYNLVAVGWSQSDGRVLWNLGDNRQSYQTPVTEYQVDNSGTMNYETFYRFQAELDTDGDGIPDVTKTEYIVMDQNKEAQITLNV